MLFFSLFLSLSPALGEETSYHIVSSLMEKLMFLTNSQQGVNPANSHVNELGNDLVRSAKATGPSLERNLTLVEP